MSLQGKTKVYCSKAGFSGTMRILKRLQKKTTSHALSDCVIDKGETSIQLSARVT